MVFHIFLFSCLVLCWRRWLGEEAFRAYIAYRTCRALVGGKTIVRVGSRKDMLRSRRS